MCFWGLEEGDHKNIYWVAKRIQKSILRFGQREECNAPTTVHAQKQRRQ